MIGYYVHHHGRGHATRAGCIARALGDADLTGLGSGAPPDDWPGRWIRLARDDDPPPAPGDATAGGTLHWAPPGHAGLQQRTAELMSWIAAERPDLLVVDVSVEIAVVARAAGVRTVVMGMPGRRGDPPHRLAYRMAEAVLGPWPAWAAPLDAGAAADPAPPAPVVPIGPISRFDRRPRPVTTAATSRHVVLLSGAGGSTISAADVDAARQATPGWSWTVLGPPGGRWHADPWPLLTRAGVVVTHAGQNAIADVAAARAPAVVIPQERPFDEQLHLAAVLERAGLAAVEPRWPAPDRWPALLERVAADGGDRWAAWSAGDGATHAARVIRRLADPASRGDASCAPV